MKPSISRVQYECICAVRARNTAKLDILISAGANVNESFEVPVAPGNERPGRCKCPMHLTPFMMCVDMIRKENDKETKDFETLLQMLETMVAAGARYCRRLCEHLQPYHVPFLIECFGKFVPNLELDMALRYSRCLLKAGVDPNEKDRDGKTVLHHLGKHWPEEVSAIVSLLMEFGLDTR